MKKYHVSVSAKTDREWAVYARLYGGGVTLLCTRPGRRVQTAARFLALRPAEVTPPKLRGDVVPVPWSFRFSNEISYLRIKRSRGRNLVVLGDVARLLSPAPPDA